MTSRIEECAGVGRKADRQRNAQRTLGTAEGILVALGWCSLDHAFAEIVDTAKRHNVSVIELANALAAIVDDTVAHEAHDDALAAAKRAWGAPADRLRACTEAKGAGPARDPAGRLAPSQTTLIDPIPLGDDADLAEQSDDIVRTVSVGDDLDDELVGGREADAADLLEQRMMVADSGDRSPDYDDDRTLSAYE
ncbi:ANTAR domain-containing protein [Mycolicibacterium fluoranthenivorans]|uniref:ANTAR domain-containing protein n=1 Tax=Mycolicibacterium fluoranthenivorans TaxID=258505 RepID=A0A7G8P9C4_9MYCO|nr:ANTAR domain-containing protein [Mycolicibacterium fluoranthenivorans]QNJ90940.1 ANTAR domain-containing protein [Mycolicibacterium fluoranthenivorans]